MRSMNIKRNHFTNFNSIILVGKKLKFFKLGEKLSNLGVEPKNLDLQRKDTIHSDNYFGTSI